MKSLYSWNVNGIRACYTKGFVDFVRTNEPDILCLQETKATREQLPEELATLPGYHSYWCSAAKKGYSGVALYSRQPADRLVSLGIAEFDDEGRTLIAQFGALAVCSCYFPNSQEGGARLEYKLRYCQALHAVVDTMVRDGLDVVVCGDFNIAHKPIDLVNPKANEKNPGYLPEERAWIDHFLQSGYRDTFRMFDEGPGNYSWWSYRFNSRAKNIGWRIDYHCVNERLADRVRAAAIHPQVFGSDHCPVSVEIDV